MTTAFLISYFHTEFEHGTNYKNFPFQSLRGTLSLDETDIATVVQISNNINI